MNLAQQIYLSDAEFVERMQALIEKMREMRKMFPGFNAVCKLSRSIIIRNETKIVMRESVTL